MANILTRLIPREVSFFGMFMEQARIIHEGAVALVDLLENYTDVAKKAEHIKDIEHQGDNQTHAIVTKLNQTFLTPFDREDIHELTKTMDDVLDLIDAVASRLVIYNVAQPRQGAAELARIVAKATEEIVGAVAVLEKRDRILDHCVEINRLENESDRVSRDLIAQLFRDEKDPVQIIKWKEMFEVIETAADKCEDVANVIEGVVLKNA